MPRMKTLALLLSAALLAPVAYAADEAASAPTAQQNKMKTCNADAGDKKGEERKAFMKQCLSAKPATQQQKMKDCNVKAGDKKGEERKAFMSECLKA